MPFLNRDDNPPPYTPIDPVPEIDLEADDVEEAIVELATDIFEINDLPSLGLIYTLLRDA